MSRKQTWNRTHHLVLCTSTHTHTHTLTWSSDPGSGVHLLKVNLISWSVSKRRVSPNNVKEAGSSLMTQLSDSEPVLVSVIQSVGSGEAGSEVWRPPTLNHLHHCYTDSFHRLLLQQLKKNNRVLAFFKTRLVSGVFVLQGWEWTHTVLR